MKLLLVEDEQRMAQALSELLRLEHYEVKHCADGTKGRDAAVTEVFDLMILDVMLPGISGFEIARQVREKGIRTPILMLTAKSEIEDKVMGLDRGADDYLTKPFQSAELLARLRALLRRSTGAREPLLSYGDISLDRNTSSLICKDRSVRFSDREFRILEHLIANQGMILTREQLAVKGWGYDSEAEYNNVEVYLSFVRRKLNFVRSKVRIKAMRGVGYDLCFEDV